MDENTIDEDEDEDRDEREKEKRGSDEETA